jgi:hypothetical protein
MGLRLDTSRPTPERTMLRRGPQVMIMYVGRVAGVDDAWQYMVEQLLSALRMRGLSVAAGGAGSQPMWPRMPTSGSCAGSKRCCAA